MKILKTSPSNIELKFDKKDLELVWEYLGPERIKGDGFYNNEYHWFEVIIEEKIVAIICLAENKFLQSSLNLSVLEIFIKYRGTGIGTEIMKELKKIAKSMNYKYMTLQTRNPSLIEFYKKFNFSTHLIGKTPIMVTSL